MSPDFPDQPYLDRIRAALWKQGAHGSASVMVGAGMSLNAQPRGAGIGRFPTWADLTSTVVDHLYPARDGAYSKHRDQAIRRTGATSGFLRLAQEYATAFGRESLERLITDAVPDLRFEPGDLHRRLLDLPWADVFTTNWDTLLERAATRVVDRHYEVVRAAADIPGSARPRIVKLHGSFPATRPLIFTEEDFRTYPVRFAPFVNLAQQSMMESVFCLVGFSGDDPNFLYWSGWVRDHLGVYAPRIYLVGWLDLPHPQRRMLEDRGVIPIDIAHLPVQSPWPEETRHQRALEWFLWSLAEAEPYRATDWPLDRQRRTSHRPAYLPQVLFGDTRFPRAENVSAERNLSLDQFWHAVNIWRHNRRLYPGWLVAPSSARRHLWRTTEYWISAVLERLPVLSPTERIEVLDDLNWRLETALVPLTKELADAISETLSAVDPLALSQDLRGRWLVLGFARLRAAREADDETVFGQWVDILSPHLSTRGWLSPRITYERCLLGLARLDHVAVERVLDDFDVTSGDAFWKVRKAGIFAELGKEEETFRLVGEALPEIRQQLSHGGADIPTLSREAWAMLLAERCMSYSPAREQVLDSLSPPTELRFIEPAEHAARRWEFLKRYGCDAREDLYEIRRMLQSEPPEPEPELVEKFDFDPGHRTRTGRGRWSSDSGGGWEHLPGLQAKRLVEEAGMPPVVARFDLAKSLLLRSAVWLAEPAPGAALGTILRVSSYEQEETFDEFLNRSRIAQLTISEVEAFVARVERALDYGVPRAAAASTEEDQERSGYWLGRVRVAVEVLSRLVLRLEADRVEKVLDRALHFYHLPLFRQDYRLIPPLANLFFRALTALDLDRIQTHVIGFLSLPVGDFEVASPPDWPDPFALAARRLSDAPPGVDSEPEWDQAIDRLIAAVASTPLQYPRWPASRRLYTLLQWGVLTEAQKARFGEALWLHQLPHGGFPEGTRFFDCGFLELPAPESGLPVELFRQRYLTVPQAPDAKIPRERFYRNLLGLVELQRQGKIDLELVPADIEQILERILSCWRSGQLRRAVENSHGWRSPFDLEKYREAFTQALGKVILPRLEAASSQVGEVWEMISDLRGLDFPVEPTYPALCRLRPDLVPELSDRLRQSLVSSRRDQAEAGVEAVWWWLRDGCQLGLGEPSPDLVREIAIAVSMRRPSLKQALRAVEWILRNDAVNETDRFARLIGEGLGYLRSAARYEAGLVRASVGGLKPNEIAEVRILCVRVARALEQAGFTDLHPVGEWIREGQTDPLPEVRHALEAR